MLVSDTGTSSTDNITSNAAITYAMPASGDTLLYQVNNGGYSTTAPTFSADGTYSVTTEQENAAGLISAPSAALTFTLETAAPTAPAAPVLVSDTGTSSTDHITSNAAITYAAPASGDTLLYQVNNGGYSTTAPTFSADGTYSVTTEQENAAGLVSAPSAALTFTLETAAPTAPAAPVLVSDTGTSSSDHITSNAAITYAMPASGDTLLYQVGNGAYSTTAPTFSADGTYSVMTEQENAAGLVSAPSAALTFTLETAAPTAPAAPVLTDDTSGGQGVTSNAAITYATPASGDTLLYQVGNGAYSTTAPTFSADGTYSVTTEQENAAGLISAPSAALTFTLETNGPAAPVTMAETDTVVSGMTVAEAAANGALKGDTDPNGGTLSITQVSHGTTADPVAAGATSTTNATVIAGAYGSLSIGADGSYGYAANNGLAIVAAADGSPITDTFGDVVTDSEGSSLPSSLAITTTLQATGTETVNDASGGATFSIGATTLKLTSDTASVYSGMIQSGSSGNTGGKVVFAGPATQVLTGTDTYTGGTTITGGTLEAHDTGSALSSGPVSIAGGATLDLDSDMASRIFLEGTTLSGTGTIKKTGTGNVSLGYNGGTVDVALQAGGTIDVAAGTLAGSANFMASYANNLGGLTIESGATFDGVEGTIIVGGLNGSGTLQGGYEGFGSTTVGAGDANGTFSGVIQDRGTDGGVASTLSLTKEGAGTQVLTGTDTYTGGTTITGGTLEAHDTGSALSSGPVSIAGGATLDLDSDMASRIFLEGTTLSGTGTIKKTGTGNVSLGYNGGTVDVALQAGGTIDVAAGTLAGSANFMASYANNLGGLTIESGATFDGVEGTIIVGGLNGSGTLQGGYEGFGSTTVGAGDANGTFSGVIQDRGTDGGVASTLSLTKEGAGTQVLTGTDTYTGGTTITGGTLEAHDTGSALSSGPVSIAGGATLDLDSDMASRIFLEGTTLSGTGTIKKTGTGNVSLGYNGGTVDVALQAGGTIDVAAGTLAGSANFMASYANNLGGLTIESGATFDGVEGTIIVGGLNGSGTLQGGYEGFGSTTVGAGDANGTFSGVIQDRGTDGGVASTLSLTKEGAGTQVLTGTDTYTGGTTITGGTLEAHDTGSALSSGPVSIAGGATLDLDSDMASRIFLEGTTLSGTGTIKKTGTGNVSLGYNGGTVDVALQAGGTIDVAAGTLAGSANFMASYANNLGGLTIESGATFDGVEGTIIVGGLNGSGTLQGGYEGFGSTTVGAGDANGTFSGVIQDRGTDGGVASTLSLTKEGAGTQVLTGTDTYTGGTTITGGTLEAHDTGSALSSGPVSIAGGATLDLDSDMASRIFLEGTTLSGTGTIKKTGTGNVSLGYNGGTVDVALQAGGTIDVAAGTLAGSANFMASYANNLGGLTIESGATFDGVEGTIIVGGLNGSGTLQGGYEGFGSTTVGAGDANGTFSGVIQDRGTDGGVASTLSLTKEGAGTQVLTGTDTYTGGTTITGGTLEAHDTGSALSSGPVSIAGGATLDLDSDMASRIFLEGTTLSGTGTIKKTGTGNVSLGYNGGTVDVALQAGGTIDVAAGTLAGSANFMASYANNLGGLTIESGATFDGVEGTIIVGGLNGSGTLQGGYEGFGSTTVGAGDANGTFSGVIQDRGTDGGVASTLSLTKEGAGTQVLTGTDTYTGGTTITGGTLELGGLGAAGTGKITFAGAATLKIDAAAETMTSATSADFTNLIDGANSANQIIDLTSLAFNADTTTASLLNGTLTVNNGTANAGTDAVTLRVTNANGKVFSTASDGHGGTLVYDPPVTAAASPVDTSWIAASMADFGGQGTMSSSAQHDPYTAASLAAPTDTHAAAALGGAAHHA